MIQASSGHRLQRILRVLVSCWLLASLPLGVWLFIAINNSLTLDPLAERQKVQQTAHRVEQLLNSILLDQTSPSMGPADLRRAIAQALPANLHGAWLQDPAGRIIPCTLDNPWGQVTTGANVPSPGPETLWAPIQLPYAQWRLGLHFTPTAQQAHPLALSLLLAGLTTLSLLLLAWWQWGRQQQQLEQTSERFHQTLDYAGDALFYIQPDDGRIARINAQGAGMLGYAQDELQALQLEDLFDRPSRKLFFRLVRRVRRKGYGEEKSLLFRRKDGSTFYGAVHARLGKFGSRPMVHGVLRDVTQARQLEQELRQKNSELRLLNRIAHLLAENREEDGGLSAVLQIVTQSFQSTGGGIYLVRDEGARLELAARCNMGDQVETAIRDLDPQRSVIGQVLVTGQAYGSPDIRQHPLLASATVLEQGWCSLQAAPLTSQGQVVGVLFLFDQHHRAFTPEEQQLLMAVGNQIGTAVSQAELVNALQWQSRLTHASNRELERSRQQLRNHLTRLEDANRTLEQLDRMKNNFLAIASHELRTPLTYILPAVEYLEGAESPSTESETRELLGSIRQGGKRLERIVRDLLEMARIESRDIYLAREKIDLRQILLQLQVQFQGTLETRRQSLSLPSIPLTLDLYGDTYHLQNALSRLLENAIKFTPDQGEISIDLTEIDRTTLEDSKPNLLPFGPGFFDHPIPPRLLQITVRDTGVGIDPEECLRIFDKFYNTGDIREHFSSNTRFGGRGVGLGLTLVKGMIEIQGGMVWVESHRSEINNGTAFHVILPLPDSPDGLYDPS